MSFKAGKLYKLVSSNIIDAQFGTTGSLRRQTVPTVIASGTLSGSFSTPFQEIQERQGFSIHIHISGSLTGSASVFVTNDPIVSRDQDGLTFAGIVQPVQVTSPTSTVTNMSASNASVTGTDAVINVTNAFYNAWQLQWSHNAGTGSIDAVALVGNS